MGGRPSDWSPVADGDPIPGDPDAVASLGRKLRKTADELERQIRNLKAVAEVDSWDSETGHEYRKKAKGSLGKLQAAYKRYDAAADAIGSRVDEVGGNYEDKLHAKPTNYATDLNRAQEISDAARKDAQEADGRKTEAEKNIHQISGGHEGSKRSSLEDDRDAAQGEIEAARRKIEEAKKIRDSAGKAACDAIENVIASDCLKDGFWDSLVADIADVTSMIATVCGIASMLVGWIPIIGQALAGFLGAVAMVATLVNVVCTLVKVMRGQADLMDLGMAALGFLMMGVGKAFGKIAGKFASRALSRLTKASSRRPAGAGRSLVKRDRKKLNKLGNSQFRLSRGDALRSLKEPFSDVLTAKGWKNTIDGMKRLRPGSGNYRESMNVLRDRGGMFKGSLKSATLADPSVASDLKAAKLSAKGLDDSLPALNKIARKATALSVGGSAITLGGLSLDGNLDPALG